MIELKNLKKSFRDFVAVDTSNWTAEDGEITGFIGKNGAGKSTTLKMITGILAPTEGTVLLNGHDIKTEPLEAKSQYGFVSDSPDHFLRLTGLEYLEFMADIYHVSEARRKEFIPEYSKRFGIEKSLGEKILSYSHGMRQKIMILGVLIHEPSIWILDEPLTGLDPSSAFELKSMMKEHVKKGNSVLFSTHVLEVAEKLCDKIVIIDGGKIIFTGSLSDLKAKYKNEDSLENIFLKLTAKKEN